MAAAPVAQAGFLDAYIQRPVHGGDIHADEGSTDVVRAHAVGEPRRVGQLRAFGQIPQQGAVRIEGVDFFPLHDDLAQRRARADIEQEQAFGHGRHALFRQNRAA